MARFLMQHEMKLTESAVNSWTVTVPAGITIEQLQEPIYWTHVAANLRQWDIIRAQYLATDGMWLATFVVTGIDEEKKNWAKVKMLSHNVLVKVAVEAALPEDPIQDKDFEIKHRGQNGGWSVIRKADSQIVFEKGKHAEDANRWIRTYRQKTAA